MNTNLPSFNLMVTLNGNVLFDKLNQIPKLLRQHAALLNHTDKKGINHTHYVIPEDIYNASINT